MIRQLCLRVFGACVAALLTGAACSVLAASAEPRTEYRLSLADAYRANQSTLARSDACGTAFPEVRGATEKAYRGWQVRHRKLIDELDHRFNMMIRSASRDEKEYP